MIYGVAGMSSPSLGENSVHSTPVSQPTSQLTLWGSGGWRDKAGPSCQVEDSKRNETEGRCAGSSPSCCPNPQKAPASLAQGLWASPQNKPPPSFCVISCIKMSLERSLNALSKSLSVPLNLPFPHVSFIATHTSAHSDRYLISYIILIKKLSTKC